MTTDTRTNEPSEAMILAALNAYSSKGLEIDGYDPVDEYPSLDMWGERFASQMRAALVAAQGAAPQAESEPRSSYISPHLPAQIRGLYRADLREKSIQTMLDLAGDLVQELIDLKAAPVLPSSGVDEEKLAEVERAAAAQALEEFADQMTTGFNAGTLNAERRAIKREARARAAEIREGKLS